MIARLWRGATSVDKADEYRAYLEKTGVAACRSTEGNRGVYVLRRTRAGRAEFLFVSLWDSVEAIRRFSGPDADKPVYYAEDRAFLLELEPAVEHYDVLVAAGVARG